MANAAIWRERVKQWRASGETSDEFVKGKGFAAATLRWWSSRLRGQVQPTSAVEPLRVVRVVRGSDRKASDDSDRSGAPGITIEIGGARVSVSAAFDRATLRDVLELLVTITKEKSA